MLALGAGWNEAEFRAFGFPFDRRASRFEEAFEVIRRLVAGERERAEVRALEEAGAHWSYMLPVRPWLGQYQRPDLTCNVRLYS